MNTDANRTNRFNQLAEAHSADLYRYAMWICGDDALAKDLVQETFLRAWRALGSLNELKAAKGWLITILRREYARTFERKVPKFTGLDQLSIADDEALQPAEVKERELLREGILRLEPRYRDPLLLQVIFGHSCEEIAEQLGITKSAVMTQLFRAREKLKARLQKDGVTGNVHELF